VNALRAAGGKVIGYVHTSYGAVPLSMVEGQIDAYRAWYQLDGIFVDEMTSDTTTAHLQYYQALYNYVHSVQPGWLVVGNPGTSVPEVYAQLPVADVLVFFESGTGYATYAPPAWQKKYAPNRFANVVYNVATAAAMQTDVGLAAARNTGWVYVTSDNLPN